MAIWFHKEIPLSLLAHFGEGTMTEFLGLEWLAVGDDFLKAKIPVDQRTIQPYGLLHGGASCVLAETVGSVASTLVVDPEKFICVGLEINANHIRGAKSGFVTATAMPLHLGSSTHVWDIKLHDDEGRLTCVSRHTVAVLPKNKVNF